jgi:hypothetical protein
MSEKSKNREPKWNYHIRRVQKFLKENGWTSFLGNVYDDECDYNTRHIIVRTVGRKPEISLYILLHEAGHAIFNKKHGDYLKYAEDLNIGKNSMSYKVIEVEEEFEAWKYGYELAEQLGIPIDKRKYEVIKSRYLATYMMNAMRRKVKFEIRNGIRRDRENRLRQVESVELNDSLPEEEENQEEITYANGESKRETSED